MTSKKRFGFESTTFSLLTAAVLLQLTLSSVGNASGLSCNEALQPTSSQALGPKSQAQKNQSENRESGFPKNWMPHAAEGTGQVAEVLRDPFVLHAIESDVFRLYILEQKNGKLEDYKELADAEPKYPVGKGPTHILDSKGQPILDPTKLSNAEMMKYLLDNYKLPDATVMNQAYFSPAEKKENHPLLKVLQRQGLISKEVTGSATDAADLIANAIQHIHKHWEVLLRENKTKGRNTLLPLPKPYVVAGGRFREAYFWDSYWIMKGLIESGYGETAKGMLENFIFMNETYGIIPNGNREYYLTRTQLPVLMEMVTLLEENGLLNFQRLANINTSAREKLNTLEGRILKETERYYRKIWKGSDRYKPEFGLVGFWDDAGGGKDHNKIVIRPESAAREPRDTEKHSQRVFAESGWDMSYSRFGLRPQDWLPVDLNMTVMGYAQKLAAISAKAGNTSSAKYFSEEAVRIQGQMNKYLYDSKTGLYVDYNYAEHRLSTVVTAASFFPFYFKVYPTTEVYQRVLTTLLRTLKPEGHLAIHTTNKEGKGQWDGEWAWAPLQEMAFQGLRKYGLIKEARKVAFDYCLMTITAFYENGFFSEKYLGKDGDITIPEGSEIYGNETGFGWTNGTVAVFLKFLAEQGDLPALEKAIRERVLARGIAKIH